MLNVVAVYIIVLLTRPGQHQRTVGLKFAGVQARPVSLNVLDNGCKFIDGYTQTSSGRVHMPNIVPRRRSSDVVGSTGITAAATTGSTTTAATSCTIVIIPLLVSFIIMFFAWSYVYHCDL